MRPSPFLRYSALAWDANARSATRMKPASLFAILPQCDNASGRCFHSRKQGTSHRNGLRSGPPAARPGARDSRCEMLINRCRGAPRRKSAGQFGECFAYSAFATPTDGTPMIDDTKATATGLPDDVKSWMDQVYSSLAEGIASQRVNAFSLIFDDGSMVAAAFVANQPGGQQTFVPHGHRMGVAQGAAARLARKDTRCGVRGGAPGAGALRPTSGHRGVDEIEAALTDTRSTLDPACQRRTVR